MATASSSTTNYYLGPGPQKPSSLNLFSDYITTIKKRQEAYTKSNMEYVDDLKMRFKSLKVQKAKRFEEVTLRPNDKVYIKKADHDGSVYSIY